MAELKKTVLGKVSGAVGDLLFRQLNGKNYIGLKPESFIPGNDPASIARRKRFTLTAKFAQAVNNIPQLKYIWKPKAPDGLTTYNYIISKSYANIDAENISLSASIVPGFGFSVRTDTVSVLSDQINVSLLPIGTNNDISLSVEKYMQLIALVYLSDPKDESVPSEYLYGLVSPIENIDLENTVEFTIPVQSQLGQLSAGYNKISGFFTLLTLDESGKVVQYSSTITG